MSDPLFTPSNKTRVKICGLTDLGDARVAIRAGADFIGLVFFERSPRNIAPGQAAELLAVLRREFPPERIRPVGVFVKTPVDEVKNLAESLHLAAVQLHGGEDLDYVRSLGKKIRIIRAVRVRDEESLEGLEAFQDCTSAFLLDAHVTKGLGGTGEGFPHHLAAPWVGRHPILIAGGLRPETVGEVIRAVKPFGVDVSSGVESSPGIKDRAKIEAFLEAVRVADREKFEEALPDLESGSLGSGMG